MQFSVNYLLALLAFQVFFLLCCIKLNLKVLIHSADPYLQPLVIIIFTFVRTFQNLANYTNVKWK